MSTPWDHVLDGVTEPSVFIVEPTPESSGFINQDGHVRVATDRHQGQAKFTGVGHAPSNVRLGRGSLCR